MKTSLKKTLALVAALVIAFPALTLSLTGCGDRANVLKIYNCGEYIADGTDSVDVVAAFEEWYQKMTGEDIRVEYSTYDTNETMYTQISNKHADYDVVCPSDYTVQKMMTNDLLLPVNDADFERIWAEVFAEEDPEAYGLEAGAAITYRNIMNEALNDLVRVYDPGWQDENGTIYSVPYMWGTFGLLYDKAKIEKIGGENAAADMESWEALFGDKYAGHIYMKNSVRDAYAAANIYNYADELKALSDGFADYGEEYKKLLDQCMNYPNDKTIESAEETLKQQKKNLYAYESDEGKEDLMNGKSAAALGFVWSCDAGYVIGQEENTDLWYTVPKEGTNVWVDNWCIPKYAGNKKAAQYFIAFVNTYDIAYENMYWIGAATPVRQAAEDIAYEIENPKSVYEDEIVGGYLESADYGEEYVEEHYEEIIAEADAGWRQMIDDEADELADYVYFLDVYLDNRDDCTDEIDCGCGWHDYARMYAQSIYPPDEHVERAAIMTDFAEKNTDIVRMFTRVKAY